MALYLTSTIQATSATVAVVGNSVDPDHPIPDNCHTIIVYNEDANDTILMGFGTAPAALAQATSVNVPPQSSITLAMGVRSERVGDFEFIYDAVGGAAIARITYVCGISS